MKKKHIRFFIIISTILVLIPWALNFFQYYDKKRGLLWLFFHQIYYAPLGSWIREPFFKFDSDIGFEVLFPGRILTGLVYFSLLMFFYYLYRLHRRKNKENG